MYTFQPKKMLILHILYILKKYTDGDHRLSQREIINLLENNYNMKVDRKAIKRNLMNLIDFGYNISYSESIQINKGGEEEILYTNWYLERDFSDSELRLLIDSLLFSKHIPNSQCKKLIKKIENLSNKHFKSKVKHISNLPENQVENKELFYNIDILNEAITRGKQVEFNYNSYRIDKKLHPRTNANDKVRQYIINPYQMVATNGRYYLICNHNSYHDVANYRIDRISNIKLLDTPSKAMKEVKGLEYGLDLPKHMAEHIYMFTGETGRVEFQAETYMVTEILDWFGKDVEFSDIKAGGLLVSVRVNYQAMRLWAVQYGKHIRVLSPQSLVN